MSGKIEKAEDAPTDWIEWSGEDVPVQETRATGFIRFTHETREDAMKRPLTILDYWPWYGEDGQPCVIEYRLVKDPIFEEGGWVEWSGVGKPDIGDAEVELKFRDGLTSDGKLYPANVIGWAHIGERDDIIAYRVRP